MISHAKKSALFLLLLLLFGTPVISQRTEETTLTLVYSPYTIRLSHGYHTLSMNGFFTRGIPGNPQLPQKVQDVELPYNADLKTVEMEILEKTVEKIPGVYEIGPAPLPLSGALPTIENGKNVEVYTKNAFYPSSPVEILGVYQMRDKKYVRVQFTPFQYNPVTKSLELTEEVTINLYWTAAASMYTAPLGLTTGYTIVTTNAIVANSTQLNAFTAYLQLRGFTVYVVTETQYGAATGQQRAINIRNWLITHYLINNLKYVLLIGNPDPDDPRSADSFGDVPMMMCFPNPANAADQTPTDYFYADLNGNWDSDGDSNYGEFGQDAVDLGPDVYVGRIPVYGADYASLDSILSKFINYTGANTSIMLPVAISNYQDEHNATNSCANGWLRTDGLDLPQFVIQNITGPAGFTSYVMYETSGVTGRGHDPVSVGAYGFSAPLTNANVVAQWGNDYGIVFWWAHGSPTAALRKYWLNDSNNNFVVEDGFCGTAGDELAWPDVLNSANTASLPNTETFTFQSSCLNGYPENGGNLQYSLLKRGAVSTVGATRVSWYAQGKWLFSGIVDNAGIGYVYVGNLVFGFSAGEALYRGKSMLVNPWAWQGWQNLFDFNLYGDPSMYLEKPLVIPPPETPSPPKPPPVNWSKLMCPVAQHRVEKARDLLEEAKDLLQKAKEAGKDVSDIEPMIIEAEKLIEEAEKYCYANNCIAGNYKALKAIELLEEAIRRLKELT